MNILFLTIGRMNSIEQHAIYTDLLRQFRDEGHSVYTVSPYEKRTGKATSYVEENGVHMLHVRVGNMTSTNLIEKGLSTVLIEKQFLDAIRKYLHNVKFDLVMYSTPPITFCNAIRYVKHRDGAKTYLLLKDIFPQNAVDLGMMSTAGVKGILYKYFRNKEKKLYSVTDFIGCMSQANVDYIINHNPEVDPRCVEICPNCVEVVDASVTAERKTGIRRKYNIPLEKKVFVYGGNLGKPQGIPFLIDCLNKSRNVKDAFFLIVGSGTEYSKIEQFLKEVKPANVRLMQRLPKEDYDAMVGACDVGMIFLDHRFTIPNFPSRLLAYMQAKLPVLVVTDPNTDVGKVIVDGGFGWWCESNDSDGFVDTINDILGADLQSMSGNIWEYLNTNYSVERGYEIIMNHFA